MSPENTPALPAADRQRLRELAKRKVEIANDPVNLERKSEWYRHRRREPGRPLIPGQPRAKERMVSPSPSRAR
ncbi:MAG: hypothetical protein NT031_10190 [Planctomycetota bacterium]|nr:hypothetical protein [Planctomycetota bacterium]